MELFVEILKWYSIVFMSIVELIFIYNTFSASAKGEKYWQFVAGAFLYAPVLWLAVWALGHGWY